MCTAVIIAGYDGVPGVFSLIFKSAFTPDAAVGGVAGLLISRAVRYGMLRGTLTNEAGLGTSPTALHACADAVSPTAQGCLGIFEVFVDTIVICTLTAVVVLLANPSGTVPIKRQCNDVRFRQLCCLPWRLDICRSCDYSIRFRICNASLAAFLRQKRYAPSLVQERDAEGHIHFYLYFVPSQGLLQGHAPSLGAN